MNLASPNLPAHQSGDDLNGCRIIGKHHRHLFGTHNPITLAPGHYFHRTAARTVDERDFVLDSVEPHRVEQDSLFLYNGLHDPAWVVGTIHRQHLARTIVDVDRQIL